MTTECFVKIDVSHHLGTVDDVVYYRRGMTIDFLLRWRWYFEYLAALIKVHNPKITVNLRCGSIDLLSNREYIKKKTHDLMIAKERRLNQILRTPAELDLFDIAANQRLDKIKKIEEDLQRLKNGEIIFYVPKEYINKIHEYAKDNV